VAEHRLAFMQVGDENITDRATDESVAVDQLRRGKLASGADLLI
jgi:hypothetical protein